MAHAVEKGFGLDSVCPRLFCGAPSAQLARVEWRADSTDPPARHDHAGFRRPQESRCGSIGERFEGGQHIFGPRLGEQAEVALTGCLTSSLNKFRQMTTRMSND